MKTTKMKTFFANDLYIFDLDGTLVDTSLDIAESVQYVLKKLNFPNRSQKAIKESIGGGACAIFKRNIPESAMDQLNLCVEMFKVHNDQNCSNKSFLYPHVLELLQVLKANNKKIAVYTFKTKFATNKILEDFGMIEYFDVVVTKDDVKKPKPDPEGIHIIMDALNYHNNEETIMIGDTLFDILTGKNAMTNTLGVTFGFDPKLVDYDTKADYYIDNYNELLDIFNGKNDTEMTT